MAVEQKRGCGYRKVGGLYLVSGELAAPCDRLPLNLLCCPTCGHGIKFSRGFQWIKAQAFFGSHRDCKDKILPCAVCTPPEKVGLLWVGEKFYESPEQFTREAAALGISKRISAIPRGFKVGETWVYLAHKKAGRVEIEAAQTALDMPRTKPAPAIFGAFKPVRIEMIVTESQTKKPRFMKKLEKKSIVPVVVPDDDPDHNPKAARRQMRARKKAQPALLGV